VNWIVYNAEQEVAGEKILKASFSSPHKTRWSSRILIWVKLWSRFGSQILLWT